MEELQILAAAQEILLKARIANATDTADKWTKVDPVLREGEVGFVAGTYPAQFKIGNGTTTWSELGWGNVTELAQLVDDANHRLVTDAQIAGWDAKPDKTYTDNAIAQGDAAALKSAKSYADTALAQERVVRESGDRTTLESAKSYADQKIADVVNGSPEALDTLKELSDALGGDANFAATVAGQIGKKVDKVAGKGLSSEDYTTAEKSKLAGISAGANNYVHPESHPASMITPDATHRFVSDTEKTRWNNKAEKTAATTAAAGLMSAADKTKLDGVAAGANNYTHPASHPATMISQDSTHRFVSDTEKGTWNGKAQAFIFDHSAYLDESTFAQQKEIVKQIFIAARARQNVVVIAQYVAIPDTAQPVMVDGLVTLGFPTATEVPGIVRSFAWDSTDEGKTLILVTALIKFKSDGTVVVERKPLSKEIVSWDGLPTYTLEKVATESGFASTYHLKENGHKIGASINIPLDQVLRGSSIKSVTTAGAPYTGAKVGDKYIEFLFQNNSTPQYLPVQDLVDVYKGGAYIEVSSTNVISLNYDAIKSRMQTDFGSVFDAKGAGAAAAKAAVDEFKASSFVIQCSIPGMD